MGKLVHLLGWVFATHLKKKKKALSGSEKETQSNE